MLDLVFTNERETINNTSFSSPLGNSDRVCINWCAILNASKFLVFSTMCRAANLELMNEILRNVDWESTGLGVNDSWGYLKLVYQDAIDKCVPKYKSKLRKNCG